MERYTAIFVYVCVCVYYIVVWTGKKCMRSEPGGDIVTNESESRSVNRIIICEV